MGRNKWELVGKEMELTSAKELFKALTSTVSQQRSYPLAVVFKGDRGKVITSFEEQNNWKLIIATGSFLQQEPINVRLVCDEREH